MLPVVLFTFAFLLLGGTEGQQLVTQCPPGFLSWQSFCYLFVNSSRVTWTQANSECQDRNSHLLRIETDAEFNFLRKAFDSNQIPQSDMYWSALNNLMVNQGAAKTPSWMWGNDAFPLDTVVKDHWDKEPSNTDYKDCVIVDVQGALGMSQCSDRRPYICEMPLPSGQDCPQNWMIGYSARFCYFVSNATDWNQMVTWDVARKRCEGNQTSAQSGLIAVQTTDVQNFLASVLPTVYNGRSVFWTALNDVSQEGTFVWAGHNSATMTSANFAGRWRQEPNNLGGNEHCATFMPGGRWNDRGCNDLVNYACRSYLPNSPQEMNFGCGSWTRAGGKCVYVYNTEKSWSDARQFCQNAGGDLLSYKTVVDADWIRMQATNNLVQRQKSGYWIGLNDQQTENTFLWPDGSEPVGSLLNWDMEPNSNQPCAVLTASGGFADFDCDHVHAGSICEEVTATCNSGWKSFNGHCYLVSTDWKTRSEASQLCAQQSRTQQGRLFALNTQAELDWIKTQFPGTTVAGIPHRFWSGLTKTSGAWIWENPDDQDPVATEKLVLWAHEPNNYNDEDCVEILANGNLNDAQCAQTRGFICQKILNLPSVAPPQTRPPPTSITRRPNTVGPMTQGPGNTAAPGGTTGAPSNNAGNAASLESRLAVLFVSLLASVVYRHL